jgi:hypothetical protein
MAMNAALKGKIHAAFPENADRAKAVIDALATEEVETEADAAHLTEADLTRMGIKPVTARVVLAALGIAPKAGTAALPANNGEPQRVIIAHEKTLKDLPRLELLTKLAAGDRSDELWDALNGKGVTVVLVREDGDILAEETDQALAQGADLQSGRPFGRHHRACIGLRTLFQQKREIDPFDGSVLADGFNNATQADWKEVPREAQAFVAYVFHFMDPASPKPTSDVLTVLEHLEGCENNAQRLSQHKRWKLAATMFAQAAKADPGLLKRIEDFLNGKVKSPKASPPPVPAQRATESNATLGSAQTSPSGARRDFTNDEMRGIRDLLCELVSDPDDIAIVLEDSGVQLSRVNRSGSATSFWFSGLEEAKRSGRVPHILDEMLRRYPHNPELNTLMRNIDIR